MTPENKKKTVEGITKVFEEMGVPKEAVHIVIYEAPKALVNRRKTAFRKTRPNNITINCIISDSETILKTGGLFPR